MKPKQGQKMSFRGLFIFIAGQAAREACVSYIIVAGMRVSPESGHTGLYKGFALPLGGSNRSHLGVNHVSYKIDVSYKYWQEQYTFDHYTSITAVYMKYSVFVKTSIDNVTQRKI